MWNLLKAWMYLLGLSIMIYVGHTRNASSGEEWKMKHLQQKNNPDARDETQNPDSVYYAIENTGVGDKGSN